MGAIKGRSMNTKQRRETFTKLIAEALKAGESVAIIAKTAFVGKVWVKQVADWLIRGSWPVDGASDYHVNMKGGGRCWVQSAKSTSYAANAHASIVIYLGLTKKGVIDPRDFDGIPIPFKDGSPPIVIEC